jgi:NAD-dependent DNA ligase
LIAYDRYIKMDILVANLTKANEAYRNGQPITMTDDEYDAGIELLASKVPNHPLLKQIRAPPSANGAVVRMPFYLGSLDKAKVSEDLEKWVKKSPAGSTFMVSEKLDGISGLWNPGNNKLYLS